MTARCSGRRIAGSGLKRRLGDERISDSRRGYFALGCCDRAYGGLMRLLDRDEAAPSLVSRDLILVFFYGK